MADLDAMIRQAIRAHEVEQGERDLTEARSRSQLAAIFAKLGSLGALRSALYRAARGLGDLNAVRKGKVGRRLLRKGIGRKLGKLLGRK